MSLSPTEYTFLSKSQECSGVILFKTALKELVLTGLLDVSVKKIIVDKRLRRWRNRLFFSVNEKHNASNNEQSYHTFFFNLFAQHSQFHLYTLRHHLNKEFKKGGLHDYQIKHIIPHLRTKRLLWLGYFSNGKARTLCKKVDSDIKFVTDAVKANRYDKYLELAVDRLDLNIMFLDSEILEELSHKSLMIKAIDKLKFIELINDRIKQLDFLLGADFSFESSLTSSFSYGGGMFSDGFGGGDFGGSGAMGSW